jgi:hypothetical protein
MDKANLSKSYQKKVKNIINKVYDWGIEFSFIIGNNTSPLKGLLIDKGEEKASDILSLEEIKKTSDCGKSGGSSLVSCMGLRHSHWYEKWRASRNDLGSDRLGEKSHYG